MNLIHPKLRPTTSLSLIVLSLLSLATHGVGQDQKISSARAPSPLTAKTPQEFVPPGWIIEEQTIGDLNGRTDHVLQLLQTPASSTLEAVAERQRALVILLRSQNGDLQRAAFADKLLLLQCPACGGALYGVTDAPAQVTIAKGILIVKSAVRVLSKPFVSNTNPGRTSFGSLASISPTEIEPRARGLNKARTF